jgi:hypothetical protein
MKYKYQSVKMGNIVSSLSEVFSQIKQSWVHYRTLDILWKYNPKGFK